MASILGKTSFPSMENSPSETPKPSQSSPRPAEFEAAMRDAGLQKVVIQSTRKREEYPGLLYDGRRVEPPRSKSYSIEAPALQQAFRPAPNSPAPENAQPGPYNFGASARQPAPQLRTLLQAATTLAAGNQTLFRHQDFSGQPVPGFPASETRAQDTHLPLKAPSSSPIRIHSGSPAPYFVQATVQAPVQAPSAADLQQATKNLSKENVELLIKNGLLSHKNKLLEEQVSAALKEAQEKEKQFDRSFGQLKTHLAQLQEANDRFAEEEARRRAAIEETKSVQTQVVEVVDSIEARLGKLRQTEAELSAFRELASNAVKELESEKAKRRAAEKELEELRAELQQAKKQASSKAIRQEQASNDTKKLESRPAGRGTGQLQATKPRANINFFTPQLDSDENAPKVNEYNPYDDDQEADPRAPRDCTQDPGEARPANPLAYDSMLHDKKHDAASHHKKNNELMSLVDNGTETSYYAQFDCPQFDLAPKRKLPNEDSMVVPVNPRTLDADESSCFVADPDKGRPDRSHPNKVESLSHSSALVGSRFHDLEKMRQEMTQLRKKNEDLAAENESLKRDLVRSPLNRAETSPADSLQRASDKDKLSFNIDSKLRFVPIAELPDANRQASSDERRESELKTGMHSIYSFKPSPDDAREKERAHFAAGDLGQSSDRFEKEEAGKASFLAHFGAATLKNDPRSKPQTLEASFRPTPNPKEAGGWPNIFSQNGDRRNGSELGGSSHLQELESTSQKDNLSTFTVGAERRREPEELKNQIAISFTKDYSSAREAATPDKDSHDEDLIDPKASHRASRDPRPSRSGKKANSFSEREGIAARNNSLENRKENSEPFFAEREEERDGPQSPANLRLLQELLETGNREVALLRLQVEKANSKLDALYEENVKLRERLHKKDGDLVKMATYLREHEREKKTLHKEIDRMSERLVAANDSGKDSVDKEEYRKLIRDCLDA